MPTQWWSRDSAVVSIGASFPQWEMMTKEGIHAECCCDQVLITCEQHPYKVIERHFLS